MRTKLGRRVDALARAQAAEALLMAAGELCALATREAAEAGYRSAAVGISAANRRLFDWRQKIRDEITDRQAEARQATAKAAGAIVVPAGRIAGGRR